MKFKKHNLLIFLLISFVISYAQAKNDKVINMNEVISEVDNYYNIFRNNEFLECGIDLMNLSNDDLYEFIKDHGNANSALIEKLEKIKQSPYRIWKVFDSEPITGLVNFSDFKLTNHITFDNKKFIIYKIDDEQNLYSKKLVYKVKGNNISLLIQLNIYRILDQKGNIEYSYKAARNQFLIYFLTISRYIYEVYAIPQNKIGSFSVSERFNLYPNGEYRWVYKNANIIVENNGIPEALFIQVCHWLQQELENNVTY